MRLSCYCDSFMFIKYFFLSDYIIVEIIDIKYFCDQGYLK